MPGREKQESPSAGLMLCSTIKIQAVIWNEVSHWFHLFGCGVRFLGEWEGQCGTT